MIRQDCAMNQGSAGGENQSKADNHDMFKTLRRLYRPLKKKNENGPRKLRKSKTEERVGPSGYLRFLVSSLKAWRNSAPTPQNRARTVTPQNVQINANSPPWLGVENAGHKLLSIPHMVSMPEIYSRLLLSHCHGYPLYHPEADLGLPSEYQRRGTSIGDVGIVTRDGTFDFLFNVYSSHNAVNPHKLPDNFEYLQPDDISSQPYIPSRTHLLSDDVKQINDSPATYRCSGPEGAVLELPKGAQLLEASNRCPFRDLAARHALNWYKYMFVDKARDASNGSLYLVTGCVKAEDWGIAVFDRPSDSQDYLRFVINGPQDREENAQPSYSWETMGAVITKMVSNTDEAITKLGEESNQCLFLRGYKIMLRKQIWDLLVSGGLVPVQFLAQQEKDRTNDPGQSDNPWGSDSEATLKPDPAGVMLTGHFGVPLLHPSDLINGSLLQRVPGANVALTHDDEWCATLPDHFASGQLPVKIDELRKRVFETYTYSVDKYGCVSLVKAQSNITSTAVVE